MKNFFELNWLLRQHKQIPIPLFIFGQLHGPQACYYRPFWGEVVIENRCYGTDKGLIVVDAEISVGIDASIAHEFRHHWQAMQDYRYPVIPHDFSENYWEQVKSYYLTQPMELDALRFEIKVAPTDLSRVIYDMLKQKNK